MLICYLNDALPEKNIFGYKNVIMKALVTSIEYGRNIV